MDFAILGLAKPREVHDHVENHWTVMSSKPWRLPHCQLESQLKPDLIALQVYCLFFQPSKACNWFSNELSNLLFVTGKNIWEFYYKHEIVNLKWLSQNYNNVAHTVAKLIEIRDGMLDCDLEYNEVKEILEVGYCAPLSYVMLCTNNTNNAVLF